MKLKTISAAALASLWATASFAVDACGIAAPCASVPEISAMEGMAAVAALLAVVALVWERRRRAL